MMAYLTRKYNHIGTLLFKKHHAALNGPLFWNPSDLASLINPDLLPSKWKDKRKTCKERLPKVTKKLPAGEKYWSIQQEFKAAILDAVQRRIQKAVGEQGSELETTILPELDKAIENRQKRHERELRKPQKTQPPKPEQIPANQSDEETGLEYLMANGMPQEVADKIRENKTFAHATARYALACLKP